MEKDCLSNHLKRQLTRSDSRLYLKAYVIHKFVTTSCALCDTPDVWFKVRVCRKESIPRMGCVSVLAVSRDR
jgi:hypothetical protein